MREFFAAPFAIAPTLEGLDAARRRLDESLRAAGATAPLIRRAELVLEELAMNVLMHGSATPEADPALTLALHVTPAELVLVLEDSGAPFDPTAAAAGPPLAGALETVGIGGLGLRLARHSADALAHERTPEGRNRTTACFRPRPDGAEQAP